MSEEHFDDEEVFETPWKTSKKEVTRYYDVFTRDSKRDKFYHSRPWRDLRVRKLKLNRLCEVCESELRLQAAKHVHHLEPIDTEEGWRRRLKLDNLQSLCVPCHNRIKRGIGKG